MRRLLEKTYFFKALLKERARNSLQTSPTRSIGLVTTFKMWGDLIVTLYEPTYVKRRGS